MPIEKLRLLSVLIVSAGISALLSGDFSTLFFIMLIGSVAPLFLGINIDRVRGHWVWRIYGLSTFAMVGIMFAMRLPVKLSVFLLVLFSIIYELYGERRPEAPARLLPLLSFLVVLYEARIESGLNLMVGMLIYIYAIVWCLFAFHVGAEHHGHFWRLWRLSVWPTLRIGTVVVALCLGVFWTMPRFETQTLSAIPTLGGDRISGFGERVTLNDIGSLKLSRKHILDLKPLSGPAPSRYLKGRVLDHYENGIWTTSIYSISYPIARQDATFSLRPHTESEAEFAVDLEALQGNTLFFFDTLTEIKGVPNPLKVVGEADHLSVMRSFPMALSYTFKSSFAPLPRSRQVSEAIYQQVPAGLEDELLRISAAIVNQEDDLPTRVRKLVRHFDSQFRYSLEVHNQDAGEPVLTFLQNSRAGHCELFASGMVLLLRAQGYSARLVTGFYLPELHRTGGFYYVTESDAHAWVEVLVDNSWQVVDPTPSSAPTPPGLFESQLASLKHFWRTKIMSWNYDRQREAYTQGQTWWRQLIDGFSGSSVLMLVVGVALIYLAWRRGSDPRGSRLTQVYMELDRVLQRQYGERNPSQGMLHWLESLSQLPAPTFLEARAFVEAYWRVRFARQTSETEAARALTQGLTLLKRLKSRKTA